MTQHSYGMIPSTPERGPFYAESFRVESVLPKIVDYHRWDRIPVHDQGRQSACVGFGSRSAVQVLQHIAGFDVELSPRYPYFGARFIERTTSEDNGANIGDALDFMMENGCSSEYLCRYNWHFYKTAPSKAAYKNGKTRLLSMHHRLMTVHEIKAALVKGPVIAGVPVTTAFEDVGHDGMIPASSVGSEILGGHCITLFGYDETGVWFPNSWGVGWACSGYGHLPYEWFTNNSLWSWEAWAVQ